MPESILKKSLKNAPGSPGIYIFKSRAGKPLYIGKALNLKNRVKSYLTTTDARLKKMTSESKKIEFVITDSDIEALILESQYIKRYKPPFNIMLRDGKQYSFVGFTNEKFPKIFITHQPNSSLQADKLTGRQADFIGPFTDAGALKTTLKLLRRIFPYCTCRQLHNNYCLNYHIDNCPGFCCLKSISELRITNYELRKYEKNIKAIRDILSGKKSSLIKNLEKEMRNLSNEEEFEKALELQRKIEKLRRVFQNAQILTNSSLLPTTETAKKSADTLKKLAKIIDADRPPHRIECYDIANIQGKHAVGAMIVFKDGIQDKNEYRKFKIYTKDTPDDTAMLKEVLNRRFNHPEWAMPNLIVVDGGKQQLGVAEIALSTQPHPPAGEPDSKKIPIIALTKNEKHIGEKIYITGKKNTVPLSSLPIEVKNLLLRLDSEAHRFAISYYRKRHRNHLNYLP